MQESEQLEKILHSMLMANPTFTDEMMEKVRKELISAAKDAYRNAKRTEDAE